MNDRAVTRGDKVNDLADCGGVLVTGHDQGTRRRRSSGRSPSDDYVAIRQPSGWPPLSSCGVAFQSHALIRGALGGCAGVGGPG